MFQSKEFQEYMQKAENPMSTDSAIKQQQPDYHQDTRLLMIQSLIKSIFYLLVLWCTSLTHRSLLYKFIQIYVGFHTTVFLICSLVHVFQRKFVVSMDLVRVNLYNILKMKSVPVFYLTIGILCTLVHIQSIISLPGLTCCFIIFNQYVKITTKY